MKAKHIISDPKPEQWKLSFNSCLQNLLMTITNKISKCDAQKGNQIIEFTVLRLWGAELPCQVWADTGNEDLPCREGNFVIVLYQKVMMNMMNIMNMYYINNPSAL